VIREWAHRVGLWLVAWADLPVDCATQPNEPTRDEPEIIAAVFKGYICHGLPVAEFEPTFDLVSVGKFYDVLGYASAVLGTAGERRTVCELVDYLKQAS